MGLSICEKYFGAGGGGDFLGVYFKDLMNLAQHFFSSHFKKGIIFCYFSVFFFIFMLIFYFSLSCVKKEKHFQEGHKFEKKELPLA